MSQPTKARVTSRSEPGSRKNAATATASAMKVRGREYTTRNGIGSFLNRTRGSSNSLPAMPAPLVLPLGDEARRGAQDVALGAEDTPRGIGARQVVADDCLGAVAAYLRY